MLKSIYMRLFWIVMAVIALGLLTVIVFVENVPKLIYNAFHRTKKKISWELMDDTENFYHR